eukprot:CAMPEP_0184861890 /NCGR_PEP_ID=MMETSP0580-20130426/6475_1 /TAXON_ID=1118495 /ORGANISM="Dactyliosolen fragilissimus" /LENGTH=985 /DNA_ID=CAMNT_0027359549 /DNA_START=154 /DNA_END=3111 /DNA_ORIENTATION=+
MNINSYAWMVLSLGICYWTQTQTQPQTCALLQVSAFPINTITTTHNSIIGNLVPKSSSSSSSSRKQKHGPIIRLPIMTLLSTTNTIATSRSNTQTDNSSNSNSNSNSSYTDKRKTYKDWKQRYNHDNQQSSFNHNFDNNIHRNNSNSNNNSNNNSNSNNNNNNSTNNNNNNTNNFSTKRKHSIHNPSIHRSPEETRRSQIRIQKAQQMLQDITDTSGTSTQDDFAKNNINIATNAQQQQYTTSSASSTSATTTPTTTTTKNTTSSTNTVPDTYWYNGNLQEGKKGDFVTRWARGVKVAEPIKRYDPISAEKLLFRQPAKWLLRNIQIGLPLALWATAVITDILTNNEPSNRKARAQQLQKTISLLGPAIIKGGQALASRSDLMPSEYLEELQKLQDDVPTFDDKQAFQTIEQELNIDSFDQVFELIQQEPVAAASIGQVYQARLKSNGDIVALKIQRPNCEQVIALDLYVLRWWSGLGNILFQWLGRDIDLTSIIDDFGELIYRELDYVAEAANAQRFSQLYSGYVRDVFVPKVYSELTTSKVLTMEWIDGYRLTDTQSLEQNGLDRKKLVDTLVQCSLRQILENGFFHADPHAGNLLACKDGRLCYLDFGMMSYADTPQRNGFLLAVVHIVNRDWDELVQLYQKLGFIPYGTDLQPIADALENTLPDALNADLSELNFKSVVSNLGDIMYTYPFSLPPFYIAIIRCLGVLEGLAIQVDPQARIINDAYPYIANRVLTDPQDELQEALRRLALTPQGTIRWNRLEGLLETAKNSEGYDVTVALDQLTNYLISDDGEALLNDLTDRIVDGTDSLGTEFIGYTLEASRALVLNDEVAAVRAFRSIQKIFEEEEQQQQQQQDDDNNQNRNKHSGQEHAKVDVTSERLRTGLADLLPEPTPSMRRFWKIASLLGARGASSDPTKLFPIVRKLAQEPKVQKTASEIAARLGERALSRSLRAAFGLSSPSFQSRSSGIDSGVSPSNTKNTK